MARRKKLDIPQIIVPLAQALVCAVGLFGGLTVGAIIISLSGLWSALHRVLFAPPSSLAMIDLAMGVLPFAIVIVCAWFGIRWGMSFAQNISL